MQLLNVKQILFFWHYMLIDLNLNALDFEWFVDSHMPLSYKQNDLQLNENFFLTQAMKLFAETKSILLANISAVRTGMVYSDLSHFACLIIATDCMKS